jgi:hypothetical protein
MWCGEFDEALDELDKFISTDSASKSHGPDLSEDDEIWQE